MRRFARLFIITCCVPVHASWNSSEAGQTDREPVQILREIDAVKIPAFDRDRKDDASYNEQFLKDLRATTEQRNALILEFFEAAPEHERTPRLMAERWSLRAFGLAAEPLRLEVDRVFKDTKNEKLKREAAYARAYASLNDRQPDEPIDLLILEDFLKLDSKDPRGATLLRIASQRSKDQTIRTALEDRMIREYPDNPYTRRMLGVRNRQRAIGKPLDLEFNDAIGGSPISIKKLRGKVVVLDFWATWCVPCVAEMPEMKRLYEKYHDQGVEFVGISLDRPEAEGGLASLKRFVKDHEIRWPQYYQGDGWDSRFSGACGIDTIPTVFVLDQEGKLHSADAQGRLEAVLLELVGKTPAPVPCDQASND